MLSSFTPLQSSSMPLHDSPTGGKTGHLYSQPSAGLPFRSLQPEVQAVMLPHTPAVQARAAALVAEHTLPQLPQLFESVCLLKPSSMRPSQLLSAPSHT